MRFLIVLAALSSAPVLLADEASHRQAASDLMKTLKVDRMMDSYIGVMTQGLRQGFVRAGGTPEHEAIFEKFSSEMEDLLREALSWEVMEKEMVDLYVESFSEDEIQALADFYSTPTGAKLLATQPELMRKGAAIGQRHMQPFIPRAQEIGRRMAAELAQVRREEQSVP